MTTLFQNIKHHYIPPTVSFEEMEEESFVMASVGGTDQGSGKDKDDDKTITDDDPNNPSNPFKKSPAKSSIFDESFDDPFEFTF